MAFPTVGYYQLNFLHSAIGLTPIFTRFVRTDTQADVLPHPTIFEDENGLYHFNYTWYAASDPDISYEVDGGPSIPVEEVRYARGTLTVRAYLAVAGGGGGGAVITSGGGGGNYLIG